MYTVTKKDGSTAEFDIRRISDTLENAFVSCGKESAGSLIGLLTLRVTADYEPRIKGDTIHTEEIRRSAAKVLRDSGFPEVSEKICPLH